MAVATGTALAIGGAAALGATAGAMGSKSSQNNTQGIDVGSASALENQATGSMGDSLSQLQGMVNAGPGQQDVSNAYGAQTNLAQMLQKYSQEGGTNPTEGDITGANNFAQGAFQAQHVQLQQAFLQQSRQAAQQAALSGRDPNDPVLKNLLAQQQTQQQSLLNAQQGSFATQYAMQQPFQRLDMANQHANVLGGLATQAMQNRQTLASMGQSIQSSERNWRLSTGTHWGNTAQTSGGGLQGALMGGLAGAGTGASVANMFSGGGTTQPAAQINSAMGAPNVGPQMPSGYAMSPMGAPNMGPQMNPFSGARYY